MSFNGFHFNKNNNQCNCPECRGVNTEIDYMELDVEFEDPNEIIEQYLEEIKEVKNENELYELLVELFNEAVIHTSKSLLFEQIKQNIAVLNSLEYETDDEE